MYDFKNLKISPPKGTQKYEIGYRAENCFKTLKKIEKMCPGSGLTEEVII